MTTMLGSELRSICRAASAFGEHLPLAGSIILVDAINVMCLKIDSMVDGVVFDGTEDMAIALGVPLHLAFTQGDSCTVSVLNERCLIQQDSSDITYHASIVHTQPYEFRSGLDRYDFHQVITSRQRLYEIVREAKRVRARIKFDPDTICFEVEPGSNAVEISYGTELETVTHTIYSLYSATAHRKTKISLDLLYRLLKQIDKDAQITLSFETDVPIKLEWLLNDKYHFQAYIAPHIERD